jgi:organic hydroperoxide reductase OsmC/OhrA
MKQQHTYQATIRWTGNTGSGTEHYIHYERSHVISIQGKPDILGSSDPAFRGDSTQHNPEDLLLSSLSACHMLWYLHLCADAGIVVTAYTDEASGTMVMNKNGSGQFTEVVLHPRVTIQNARHTEEAIALHDKAHQMCFIANSVNFEVRHHPVIDI